MINVAKLRASIDAAPGDIVALSKAQMAELIAELEVGHTARRSLTSLRSITAVAASAAGLPA